MSRELLQQALDALENPALPVYTTLRKDIRIALAQPTPVVQPLTNGEIYTAYITATNQTLRPGDERLAFAFARAIEAAHGIGGGGNG